MRKYGFPNARIGEYRKDINPENDFHSTVELRRLERKIIQHNLTINLYPKPKLYAKSNSPLWAPGEPRII